MKKTHFYLIPVDYDIDNDSFIYSIKKVEEEEDEEEEKLPPLRVIYSMESTSKDEDPEKILLKILKELSV